MASPSAHDDMPGDGGSRLLSAGVLHSRVYMELLCGLDQVPTGTAGS